MNLPFLLCLIFLIGVYYLDYRGERRQKLKYEPLKRKPKK
jgi:hypothetical protein